MSVCVKVWTDYTCLHYAGDNRLIKAHNESIRARKLENDALARRVCCTEQMMREVGGLTHLFDNNPSTGGRPANQLTSQPGK